MSRSDIGYDYDLFAGHIRDSPLGGTFLDSVNTAEVALMATMAMKLGRTSLVDRWIWGYGLTSAALLLRFRVNAT